MYRVRRESELPINTIVVLSVFNTYVRGCNNGVLYVETSAKTSKNTNDALETIARDAFLLQLDREISVINVLDFYLTLYS